MFLLNQIAKGSACKVTNYNFKNGTSNDSVIELHAIRKREYQQKNVWEKRSFELWNENARQQDLMENSNATKELGPNKKKKLRMHIKPPHKRTHNSISSFACVNDDSQKSTLYIVHFLMFGNTKISIKCE